MTIAIDKTFIQPAAGDINDAAYMAGGGAYQFGYRAAVVAAKVTLQNALGIIAPAPWGDLLGHVSKGRSRCDDLVVAVQHAHRATLQEALGLGSGDPPSWEKLLDSVREREAALERERNRADACERELQEALRLGALPPNQWTELYGRRRELQVAIGMGSGPPMSWLDLIDVVGDRIDDLERERKRVDLTVQGAIRELQSALGRDHDDPMAWPDLLDGVRDVVRQVTEDGSLHQSAVDSATANRERCASLLEEMTGMVSALQKRLGLPDGTPFNVCLSRAGGLLAFEADAQERIRSACHRLRDLLSGPNGPSSLEDYLDRLEAEWQARDADSEDSLRERVAALLTDDEWRWVRGIAEPDDGDSIVRDWDRDGGFLMPDVACALLAVLSRRTGKMYRLSELVEGWIASPADGLMIRYQFSDSPDEAILIALRLTMPVLDVEFNEDES